LNFSEQLFAPTIDHVDLVVGQISPFRFDLAFELAPIAFDLIPIHHGSPCYLRRAMKDHRRA